MTKITTKKLTGTLNNSGIGSVIGAGYVYPSDPFAWPSDPAEWGRDKDGEAERIQRFMEMIGSHGERKSSREKDAMKAEVEEWKEKCRVLELDNKALRELNGHLERALVMLGNTTTKENTNV